MTVTACGNLQSGHDIYLFLRVLSPVIRPARESLGRHSVASVGVMPRSEASSPGREPCQTSAAEYSYPHQEIAFVLRHSEPCGYESVGFHAPWSTCGREGQRQGWPPDVMPPARLCTARASGGTSVPR